jgi:tetratricopeptide (TPR) repeat protein
LVHAEAAVVAAPAEFRYRLNRGIVLVEHGRFAEAIADFDFALARDPALPYAYLEKGSALLSLNRDEEARLQWPLARKADPSIIWPEWYEALDDFIHRRFADAATRFDRVAAAEPAFAPADVWRALSRARAGLPPPPITRSGEDWPVQLYRLHRGELTLEQVLAIAAADTTTGDRRRVGEALFVAAERAAVAGQARAARELYERSVAVSAPRHAWKVAAERELSRLQGAEAHKRRKQNDGESSAPAGEPE